MSSTCGDTDGSAVVDLRDYLVAVFGDGEGYVHVAAGKSGHFTDTGAYAFKRTKDHPNAAWKPRTYEWPGDIERIASELHGGRDVYDIYLCPYLMVGTKRTPGDVVELNKIHADIDGECPLDKVQAIGGGGDRIPGPRSRLRRS